MTVHFGCNTLVASATIKRSSASKAKKHDEIHISQTKKSVHKSLITAVICAVTSSVMYSCYLISTSVALVSSLHNLLLKYHWMQQLQEKWFFKLIIICNAIWTLYHSIQTFIVSFVNHCSPANACFHVCYFVQIVTSIHSLPASSSRVLAHDSLSIYDNKYHNIVVHHKLQLIILDCAIRNRWWTTGKRQADMCRSSNNSETGESYCV